MVRIHLDKEIFSFWTKRMTAVDQEETEIETKLVGYLKIMVAEIKIIDEI